MSTSNSSHCLGVDLFDLLSPVKKYLTLPLSDKPDGVPGFFFNNTRRDQIDKWHFHVRLTTSNHIVVQPVVGFNSWENLELFVTAQNATHMILYRQGIHSAAQIQDLLLTNILLLTADKLQPADFLPPQLVGKTTPFKLLLDTITQLGAQALQSNDSSYLAFNTVEGYFDKAGVVVCRIFPHPNVNTSRVGTIQIFEEAKRPKPFTASNEDRDCKRFLGPYFSWKSFHDGLIEALLG